MATNELKSLTEIFSNRFYRIPDYQRGYAWSNPQLVDFWDDLIRVINKPDSIHYTGMLTVEKIDKNAVSSDSAWEDEKPYFKQGMEAYYVIDGQQRLTTSIILISVLLNFFKSDQSLLYENKIHWQNIFLYKNFDDFNSYRFGYIKDMPSYEFFKTVILGQDSIYAANVADDTLYTRNLQNAKMFFEDKLKNLDSEQLQNVFQRLISSFKFNFYEINSDLDVFVAFETMNNRGKPLSKLELLKNRLIYLSTLLNDGTSEDKSEQLRSAINAAWRTVYEFLGKDSNRELVDDDFLRDHWIMYFPEYNREEAKAYANYLLGEYFTTKRIDTKELTASDISAYVKSIQNSIKHWYQMFNPRAMKENLIQSQTELLRLNHLGFTTFQPLIISAISQNPEDRDLTDLLKSIERFIFLAFQISRRRTNTQNSHFFKRANQCFNLEISISEMTSEIKKMTDEWLSVSNFKNYIDDIFRNDKGFYSWNGLRYFLFEYEASLIPINNGVSKVPREDYISRKLEESIEHVFPQNPDNEEWLVLYAGFSESELHHLKNSLGNLLILSVSSNASASRRTFKEKCFRVNSKNETVGYANGSYSEIKVSQDYKDGWNSEAILTRGLDLLCFLERNWGLSLGDKEDKVKLLGLTFVINKS